jgi:hypothetical protein
MSQGALFGPEPPGPPDDRKPWQRSTFDLPAARAARDEAVSRVDRHAEDEWRDAALNALYRVAQEQPTLISNDLWRYVDKPPEPRALGPLMQRGVTLGWIMPTETFRPCPSVSRHAAPARLWRSKVYQTRGP